jgi:Ca2+-transporting ATPase
LQRILKTARAIKPNINQLNKTTMTHIYNGLTALQVAENRNYFGANTLSHAPLEYDTTENSQQILSSWFVRGVLIVVAAMLFIIPLFDLFTGNVPYEIWIAFVACVLLLTSVAAVVLVVAAIRFILQRRKEKQREYVNSVRDKALVRVVRDGRTMQVPRMDIVVGDVILLGVGDEVPADAVLLESTELVVSEYILNGKFECEKTSQRLECELGEVFQPNYVMCGSIVLQGEAVAQVFAVGNHSANYEERL